MIERIFVNGVPCTLVATAHITLPGDEQVEASLHMERDVFGVPSLGVDISQAYLKLDERETQNP